MLQLFKHAQQRLVVLYVGTGCAAAGDQVGIGKPLAGPEDAQHTELTPRQVWHHVGCDHLGEVGAQRVVQAGRFCLVVVPAVGKHEQVSQSMRGVQQLRHLCLVKDQAVAGELDFERGEGHEHLLLTWG